MSVFGNRFPKEDMLIKIANYFNCSLDYLFGRFNINDSKIKECEKNIRIV